MRSSVCRPLALLALLCILPQLSIGSITDKPGLIQSMSVDSLTWDHYHSYDDIVAVLLSLNETYADHVNVFSIGKSWQGKDIYCARLTNESQAGSKPRVLFVGYHHAREPITAELTLYFVVQAAMNFGINETLTFLLNHSEIFVVVALNVDGFDAVRENEWQRKNARPVDEDGDNATDEDAPFDADGDGYVEALYETYGFAEVLKGMEGNDTDGDSSLDWIGGVDLNRNYGYQWNATCASGSSDVRAEDYRGQFEFSEPETQAIRDLALAFNFSYSVSFHSGSELVLYPWEYDYIPTPDDAQFKGIGGNLSQLVNAKCEQGCDLYTTSGSMDDWIYETCGTMAFTCEIYSNPQAWQEEPGPENNTIWKKGIFQVFNPYPVNILSVINRWLPSFTYIANYAVEERCRHDVTVTGVTPVRTHVGATLEKPPMVEIDAILADAGELPETLDVALYVDYDLVATQQVLISEGETRELRIKGTIPRWRYATYNVSVYAEHDWREENTSDNVLSTSVLVTLPGDITGDLLVDNLDVDRLKTCFGLDGDTKADSNADVNGDSSVNCRDAILLGAHFGSRLLPEKVCFSGFNDDAEISEAWYPPTKVRYAIPYLHTESHYLAGIELFAGGAQGNFTVQLFSDRSFQPSEDILAEATILLTDVASWRRIEFTEPVLLLANVTYWIVLTPTPESSMSVTSSGDAIYTLIDFGVGWRNYFTMNWVIRLYEEVLKESPV